MEAKDTLLLYSAHMDALLLQQAEISFKAGMFEVVEWINQHLTNLVVSTPNQSGIYKTLNENQWQSQLKNWGINENR